MNTGAPSIDTTTERPRAGFWRRSFSLIIDTIVVMLPFQLLAAALFALTAGHIQMNDGFFSYCEDGKNIPQGLNPPPPHDSNAMRVCRTSFLGGVTTGATLTVGRVTREGSSTRTVSQSYFVDKDGTPINATSIDGVVQLALLIYLVGMIWKSGRTLGARVVRVRVLDTANPSASGVPLGKAVVRYLAMVIGWLPAIGMLVYQYEFHGGSADAMFTDSFFRWIQYALGLGALWEIVLIVQIARKTDPVYDRLAGTAVVRA